MQFGNHALNLLCVRCGEPVRHNPAFSNEHWYHRSCLAEQRRRDQERADKIAARFGFAPVTAPGTRPPPRGDP